MTLYFETWLCSYCFCFKNVDLELFRLSWCAIFLPDSTAARLHTSSGQSRNVLDKTSNRAIIFMTKRGMFSCDAPFFIETILPLSCLKLKINFCKYIHILTLRMKAKWFGVQGRAWKEPQHSVTFCCVGVLWGHYGCE